VECAIVLLGSWHSSGRLAGLSSLVCLAQLVRFRLTFLSRDLRVAYRSVGAESLPVLVLEKCATCCSVCQAQSPAVKSQRAWQTAFAPVLAPVDTSVLEHGSSASAEHPSSRRPLFEP
jgi:hypothetical protein